MPRIFDNIDQRLLPALKETLGVSSHADFCVGYLNLRGWKSIDEFIERWSGGEGNCCRLLVGMQRLPEEDLKLALSVLKNEDRIDQQTAIKLKRKMADEFRKQLAIGFPSDIDEIGLRKLASQIKFKKVVVKLFLGYPLHAKLYLLFRTDINNPRTAFLGSSNLTFAGLSMQGELNVDVLDHDATEKLAMWFEDRWNDRLCIDISNELVQIIDESWAGDRLLSPYHIYLKIAYHLAQEARTGLEEFQIPKEFGNKLFQFQTAAVKIAAHHLNRRNGVLIGDVVGLGKTIMATAIARIFEEDYGCRTLIICPKNLVKMWEDYRYEYGLRANVISVTQAQNQLSELRRYQLVIIDESHNLRNREGSRYQAIREYIQENDSKVILLTATPYNKTYLDLSNQLRLFIPDDRDLGIRPDELIRAVGEVEFMRRYQCPFRSMSAFEKSLYATDWQELMRLYMVRRTRSFVKENYAFIDCPQCGTTFMAREKKCSNCDREKQEEDQKYLVFEDGTKSFFPQRDPKKIEFDIDESDPNDQYARLYADDIVDIINNLELPRYGLGNYLKSNPEIAPTNREEELISGLSRAGRRLKGYSRTNLFKRLESSGLAFILSIKRHIMRNYVFLHAIENGLDLPIGSQDIEMLDPRFTDTDEIFQEDENEDSFEEQEFSDDAIDDFKNRAEAIYNSYLTQFKRRFKWIRTDLFDKSLATYLKKDTEALQDLLVQCGEWDVSKDAKLQVLYRLLSNTLSDKKAIVFSQFADTVYYIEKELKAKGILKLAGVTGSASDPTALAYRFSPVSNEKRDRISEDDELRVLISTDVLSEGQNLQDCHIVVNYDLPWAIIRLIQRVGRVDRIGQQNDTVTCYSFLPAEGVEKIINLRDRLKSRLKENEEVVGTDEVFFEDDESSKLVDLYNEKSGILDGEDDREIDLTSKAYQIWNNAITKDPELKKIIPKLQNACYATKPHEPAENKPSGALVYLRTADGNDALTWVDENKKSVTESQYAILRIAECEPDTPALPRRDDHHDLVAKGVEMIIREQRSAGGQLGSPRGARFRTYERLKNYAEEIKDTLFNLPELHKAIQEIYLHPLKETAKTTLNRQLRSGISDSTLAELVISLSQEERLCIIHDEDRRQEPQIICSMGLKEG